MSALGRKENDGCGVLRPNDGDVSPVNGRHLRSVRHSAVAMTAAPVPPRAREGCSWATTCARIAKQPPGADGDDRAAVEDHRHSRAAPIGHRRPRGCHTSLPAAAARRCTANRTPRILPDRQAHDSTSPGSLDPGSRGQLVAVVVRAVVLRRAHGISHGARCWRPELSGWTVRVRLRAKS